MKHLASTSLLLAILLSPLSFTWANDGPLSETELVERQLLPAGVQEDSKTRIELSDGRVFELERMPDKELMRQALGLNLPEKAKEEILKRGGSIEVVNPIAGYDAMSGENQQKFRDTRLVFLSNAARILNSTKFALGAGSVVGDGLTFVKVKTLKVFGKKTEQAEKVQRSFSQRSHDAVQSVLRGIDYKLWSQAPLVIESNEFGLSVSLGILAETGVLRRGGGGAEELGFSLAINKSKKAFVFEIFHNSEKFDNTKAAITVLGVVGKVGMTLGQRQGAESLKGSSFYPPAVPGFASSSKEYFAAGFSSSLGFPPPPLADLMTFTNTFERTSIIRITVSPVVKGFVRIHIGDLRAPVRLVAMRFVDVFNAINDKVVSLAGRRACGRVFN